MSDNSVNRLIDDLNGLNEKAEHLIYKIEHIIAEEEKVENINDEDMQYDREADDLRGTRRDNDGTGMEILQQDGQ